MLCVQLQHLAATADWSPSRTPDTHETQSLHLGEKKEEKRNN